MAIQNKLLITFLVCNFAMTFASVGLLSASLSEISKIDVSQLSCATPRNELIQMKQNLNQWSDILDNQALIPKDINTLQKLEIFLIQTHEQFKKKEGVFLQMESLSQVIQQKLNLLELPQVTQIGKVQINEIMAQVNSKFSSNQEYDEECSQTVLKLVNDFVNQLKNVNQQCQDYTPTYDIKFTVQNVQNLQDSCDTDNQSLEVTVNHGESVQGPETDILSSYDQALQTAQNLADNAEYQQNLANAAQVQFQTAQQTAQTYQEFAQCAEEIAVNLTAQSDAAHEQVAQLIEQVNSGEESAAILLVHANEIATDLAAKASEAVQQYENASEDAIDAIVNTQEKEQAYLEAVNIAEEAFIAAEEAEYFLLFADANKDDYVAQLQQDKANELSSIADLLAEEADVVNQEAQYLNDVAKENEELANKLIEESQAADDRLANLINEAASGDKASISSLTLANQEAQQLEQQAAEAVEVAYESSQAAAYAEQQASALYFAAIQAEEDAEQASYEAQQAKIIFEQAVHVAEEALFDHNQADLIINAHEASAFAEEAYLEAQQGLEFAEQFQEKAQIADQTAQQLAQEAAAAYEKSVELTNQAQQSNDILAVLVNEAVCGNNEAAVIALPNEYEQAAELSQEAEQAVIFANEAINTANEAAVAADKARNDANFASIAAEQGVQVAQQAAEAALEAAQTAKLPVPNAILDILNGVDQKQNEEVYVQQQFGLDQGEEQGQYFDSVNGNSVATDAQAEEAVQQETQQTEVNEVEDSSEEQQDQGEELGQNFDVFDNEEPATYVQAEEAIQNLILILTEEEFIYYPHSFGLIEWDDWTWFVYTDDNGDQQEYEIDYFFGDVLPDLVQQLTVAYEESATSPATLAAAEEIVVFFQTQVDVVTESYTNFQDNADSYEGDVELATNYYEITISTLQEATSNAQAVVDVIVAAQESEQNEVNEVENIYEEQIQEETGLVFENEFLQSLQDDILEAQQNNQQANEDLITAENNLENLQNQDQQTQQTYETLLSFAECSEEVALELSEQAQNAQHDFQTIYDQAETGNELAIAALIGANAQYETLAEQAENAAVSYANANDAVLNALNAAEQIRQQLEEAQKQKENAIYYAEETAEQLQNSIIALDEGIEFVAYDEIQQAAIQAELDAEVAEEIAINLVKQAQNSKQTEKTLINFYQCAEEIAEQLVAQADAANEVVQTLRVQADAGDQQALDSIQASIEYYEVLNQKATEAVAAVEAARVAAEQAVAFSEEAEIRAQVALQNLDYDIFIAEEQSELAVIASQEYEQEVNKQVEQQQEEGEQSEIGYGFTDESALNILDDLQSNLSAVDDAVAVAEISIADATEAIESFIDDYNFDSINEQFTELIATFVAESEDSVYSSETLNAAIELVAFFQSFAEETSDNQLTDLFTKAADDAVTVVNLIQAANEAVIQVQNAVEQTNQVLQVSAEEISEIANQVTIDFIIQSSPEQLDAEVLVILDQNYQNLVNDLQQSFEEGDSNEAAIDAADQIIQFLTQAVAAQNETVAILVEQASTCNDQASLDLQIANQVDITLINLLKDAEQVYYLLQVSDDIESLLGEGVFNPFEDLNEKEVEQLASNEENSQTYEEVEFEDQEGAYFPAPSQSTPSYYPPYSNTQNIAQQVNQFDEFEELDVEAYQPLKEDQERAHTFLEFITNQVYTYKDSATGLTYFQLIAQFDKDSQNSITKQSLLDAYAIVKFFQGLQKDSNSQYAAIALDEALDFYNSLLIASDFQVVTKDDQVKQDSTNENSVTNSNENQGSNENNNENIQTFEEEQENDQEGEYFPAPSESTHQYYVPHSESQNIAQQVTKFDDANFDFEELDAEAYQAFLDAQEQAAKFFEFVTNKVFSQQDPVNGLTYVQLMEQFDKDSQNSITKQSLLDAYEIVNFFQDFQKDTDSPYAAIALDEALDFYNQLLSASDLQGEANEAQENLYEAQAALYEAYYNNENTQIAEIQKALQEALQLVEETQQDLNQAQNDYDDNFYYFEELSEEAYQAFLQAQERAAEFYEFITTQVFSYRDPVNGLTYAQLWEQFDKDSAEQITAQSLTDAYEIVRFFEDIQKESDSPYAHIAYDEALAFYNQLLAANEQQVSANKAEQTLNEVLEILEASQQANENAQDLVERFSDLYEASVTAQDAARVASEAIASFTVYYYNTLVSSESDLATSEEFIELFNTFQSASRQSITSEDTVYAAKEIVQFLTNQAQIVQETIDNQDDVVCEDKLTAEQKLALLNKATDQADEVLDLVRSAFDTQRNVKNLYFGYSEESEEEEEEEDSNSECQNFTQITNQNASDVLSKVSEFLQQQINGVQTGSTRRQCYCLDVAAASTSTGLLSSSLAEVTNIDVSKLSCATPQAELIQMTSNLQQWQGVLANKALIPNDIKTLKQVEIFLIQTNQKLKSHQTVLLQLSDVQTMIEKKLSLLELPKSQSKIGESQLNEILAQLTSLSSSNQEQNQQCCETVLQLVNDFVSQLTNLNAQCQASPATDADFLNKINDVNTLNSNCNADDDGSLVRLGHKGGAGNQYLDFVSEEQQTEESGLEFPSLIAGLNGAGTWQGWDHFFEIKEEVLELDDQVTLLESQIIQLTGQADQAQQTANSYQGFAVCAEEIAVQLTQQANDAAEQVDALLEQAAVGDDLALDSLVAADEQAAQIQQQADAAVEQYQQAQEAAVSATLAAEEAQTAVVTAQEALEVAIDLAEEAHYQLTLANAEESIIVAQQLYNESTELNTVAQNAAEEAIAARQYAQELQAVAEAANEIATQLQVESQLAEETLAQLITQVGQGDATAISQLSGASVQANQLAEQANEAAVAAQEATEAAQQASDLADQLENVAAQAAVAAEEANESLEDAKVWAEEAIAAANVLIIAENEKIEQEQLEQAAVDAAVYAEETAHAAEEAAVYAENLQQQAEAAQETAEVLTEFAESTQAIAEQLQQQEEVASQQVSELIAEATTGNQAAAEALQSASLQADILADQAAEASQAAEAANEAAEQAQVAAEQATDAAEQAAEAAEQAQEVAEQAATAATTAQNAANGISEEEQQTTEEGQSFGFGVTNETVIAAIESVQEALQQVDDAVAAADDAITTAEEAVQTFTDAVTSSEDLTNALTEEQAETFATLVDTFTSQANEGVYTPETLAAAEEIVVFLNNLADATESEELTTVFTSAAEDAAAVVELISAAVDAVDNANELIAEAQELIQDAATETADIADDATNDFVDSVSNTDFDDAVLEVLTEEFFTLVDNLVAALDNGVVTEETVAAANDVVVFLTNAVSDQDDLVATLAEESAAGNETAAVDLVAAEEVDVVLNTLLDDATTVYYLIVAANDLAELTTEVTTPFETETVEETVETGYTGDNEVIAQLYDDVEQAQENLAEALNEVQASESNLQNAVAQNEQAQQTTESLSNFAECSDAVAGELSQQAQEASESLSSLAEQANAGDSLAQSALNGANSSYATLEEQAEAAAAAAAAAQEAADNAETAAQEAAAAVQEAQERYSNALLSAEEAADNAHNAADSLEQGLEFAAYDEILLNAEEAADQAKTANEVADNLVRQAHTAQQTYITLLGFYDCANDIAVQLQEQTYAAEEAVEFLQAQVDSGDSEAQAALDAAVEQYQALTEQVTQAVAAAEEAKQAADTAATAADDAEALAEQATEAAQQATAVADDAAAVATAATEQYEAAHLQTEEQQQTEEGQSFEEDQADNNDNNNEDTSTQNAQAVVDVIVDAQETQQNEVNEVEDSNEEQQDQGEESGEAFYGDDVVDNDNDNTEQAEVDTNDVQDTNEAEYTTEVDDSVEEQQDQNEESGVSFEVVFVLPTVNVEYEEFDLTVEFEEGVGNFETYTGQSTQIGNNEQTNQQLVDNLEEATEQAQQETNEFVEQYGNTFVNEEFTTLVSDLQDAVNESPSSSESVEAAVQIVEFLVAATEAVSEQAENLQEQALECDQAAIEGIQNAQDATEALTDAINAANDLLDTIQTAYVTDAVYENNYEEYVPEPTEEEASPAEEENTATEETENTVTNEHTANAAACSSFVVVTKDNASDIMCALGNYLNAQAHGGYDGPTNRICFCLDYSIEEDATELIQLTQTQSVPYMSMQTLINNRRNRF